MGLRWYSTVINCRDPRALAHWWAETLGWQLVHEADDECVAVPAHLDIEDLRHVPWAEMPPGLVFVPVPEDKAGLNRLHLDLACHVDDDRDALIAGLVERGATYADVGQGDDVTWTVLRDPEGNEFCVLSAREF
jgi:catechol 2,3-dioxygenase-like lactoylglutathione lyase family enzyme